MLFEWGGQTANIRGLGSGPSVLLIHGFPLDGAMWSAVARALSGKFRVFKPDLPGRQDNPAPASGSIESYADFVGALLETVPPPVGLAGFSMGGYVALALMKRRPENVRALALVDTRAASDDEAGKARRNDSIGQVREHGVGPLADSMPGSLLSPPSLQKAELLERVRRMILRQKPETIVADLSAMRDRSDSSSFLKQISAPTLVLVGEEDALTPPTDSEAMAAAIPGARLVRIPGAGHLTPMESPKAVAAALADFFAQALTG